MEMMTSKNIPQSTAQFNILLLLVTKKFKSIEYLEEKLKITYRSLYIFEVKKKNTTK